MKTMQRRGRVKCAALSMRWRRYRGRAAWALIIAFATALVVRPAWSCQQDQVVDEVVQPSRFSFVCDFVPAFVALPKAWRESPLTDEELIAYIKVAAALQQRPDAVEEAMAAGAAAYRLNNDDPFHDRESIYRIAILMRLMYEYPGESAANGAIRPAGGLPVRPVDLKLARAAAAATSPVLWNPDVNEPMVVAVPDMTMMMQSLPDPLLELREVQLKLPKRNLIEIAAVAGKEYFELLLEVSSPQSQE